MKLLTQLVIFTEQLFHLSFMFSSHLVLLLLEAFRSSRLCLVEVLYVLQCLAEMFKFGAALLVARA